MKKLAYGIGGLVLVIVLFWVFVVDWLVEREIERNGTEAVGALVELDAADLQAFPPGIELTRLQVTNPIDPMTNAVEVRRIAGYLDAMALLGGRVIVDLLAIEGVRFGTERASSGAVAGAESPAAPELGVDVGSFELPSFEVPDVKSILEGEELETLALIEETKADIEGFQDRWKKKLDELPNEKSFDKYRERIEKAADVDGGVIGALGSVGEIDAIRKDVKRDLKSLEQAAGSLDGEVKALQKRIDALKKAPMNDIRRLRDKYGLSPEGLSNLSKRLLGDQIDGVVAELVALHERLGPMLEGGGEAEPAVGDDAALDFLVRLAKVSIELDAGEIAGDIKNITTNQPAFGKPLSFDFQTDALPGLSGFSLTGVLDHVRPATPSDTLAFRATGFDAGGTVLSGSDRWPIEVSSGSADLDVSATVGAGQLLDATAGFSLREASIAAPFEGSAVAGALRGAIEGITELDVKARITGTLSAYEIAIESNADQIFASAVKGLVAQQTKVLQERLTEEIQGRVAGPLASVGSIGGQMGAMRGEIDRRLDLGQDLLTSQVTGTGTGKKKKGIGGIKLPSF